VKVVLVGFSKVLDILHMGEGNNCFFIHLNDADDRAFVRPWQSQSAGIIEFLEGNMRSAIETISVDIQPRSSTKEEQLNRAIAKGPYFFENEFLSFFVKKIREKDAVLRSFLARIKQLGQLMNTKLVTLGAAGDSDFYFIPLAEYILEGLNPDKHGEVKAYCESSQFNMDKYGKANLHAYNHDLLIIVSTNNVQKEVWKTIITVRDAEHRFKHVLFDREIMLLLLGVLDIDLSGVLNE
jgi:hypothetical protein